MASKSTRRSLLFLVVVMLLGSVGVAVARYARSPSSLGEADATLSPQQADSFDRKMSAIAGPSDKAVGSRRTALTEGELNSWFAYRAQALLPSGVAEPRISMVGDGKLAGRIVVDLDRVGGKKGGGAFDPLSFLGGRLPVSVTGTLQTGDGVGHFEIETAQVSTVQVPKFLIQQLLSTYSKTPEHPAGLSLDAPFKLPSNIRRIEVGRGQAVVVQ